MSACVMMPVPVPDYSYLMAPRFINISSKSSRYLSDGCTESQDVMEDIDALADSIVERVTLVHQAPAKEKRVKFADSVGLELVQIRHMTAGRDTPPNLSPSIMAMLRSEPEKLSGPSLSLNFYQPVSDYGIFRQSLEKNFVSLESLSISDNRLIGTIKVKNLAFSKSVFLRITYDDWHSYEDIDAYYVNNGLVCAQGAPFSLSIDTFSFDHEIPYEKLMRPAIHFAVGFRCESHEYWDNNDSKNYTILVHNSSQREYAPTCQRQKSLDDTNWSEYAAWKLTTNDFTPYW